MNSDLNKQIGKRLKELRESKNLTRKELSAKLNISEGGLEKWESGDREISTENLYLIANYFNVDFNYLYGIESKKDGTPKYIGYMNIGKRLRQRREELGYSRSELEEKFSCCNIEKIELNNGLCDYEGFMRIAEALKMSFEELICGNEPDKFVENEFTKKREAELVFDGVIDTELFGGCDSPEFVKYLIDKYYKAHLVEERRKVLFESVKTLYDGASCFDETNSELEECYNKNNYADIQYILYKRLCYKLYWFFEGKLDLFKNNDCALKKKYSWYNGSALDLYNKFASIKSVPTDIDKNFRYLLKVTRNQNCELTEEQLKSCEKFINSISAFY